MNEETRAYHLDQTKLMKWVVIFAVLFVISCASGASGDVLFLLACATLWSLWKTIFPSQILVVSADGVWLQSVKIPWSDISTVELADGELIVSQRDSTTGGKVPGWDRTISLNRLSETPETVFAEVQQFQSRYGLTP